MMATRYIREKGIESIDECYQIEIIDQTLLSKELIKKIVFDMLKGVSVQLIALKFHYTLVRWIEHVAIDQDCRKLAFSGGVFQNGLLVDLIITKLGRSFDLHFHKELSPNDENISFGQLIYHEIISKQEKKG